MDPTHIAAVRAILNPDSVRFAQVWPPHAPHHQLHCFILVPRRNAPNLHSGNDSNERHTYGSVTAPCPLTGAIIHLNKSVLVWEICCAMVCLSQIVLLPHIVPALPVSSPRPRVDPVTFVTSPTNRCSSLQCLSDQCTVQMHTFTFPQHLQVFCGTTMTRMARISRAIPVVLMVDLFQN